MISKISKLPAMFALGPLLATKDYDTPAKGYYYPKNDNEDGWERVKRMFGTDDFGRMSGELNSIYQAGFMGLFTGAVYGGFLGSRKSYFDFMDRNQATAFQSHLDAKRKLQDQVTMGFAKNAYRFGWRLALFTTTYTSITTIIAVYRGKSSMYEYITAGVVTGGTYKFNMGLKGMAAGALVGGGLGAIAGGLSLLILKSTGMTMEEVRYWQYKWRSSRDDAIQDSYRETFKNSDRNDELYEEHDAKARVGSNLDLKTAIADEWKAAKAIMPQEPVAVAVEKK